MMGYYYVNLPELALPDLMLNYLIYWSRNDITMVLCPFYARYFDWHEPFYYYDYLF